MNAQGWRTVDIVVAAVIGVAFGVVFWAWGLVWAATGPLFEAVPPAQYLISGVWLVAGVLGAFVIRKPGAALFTETVAAAASALLGSAWGLDTVSSGIVQGLGAEVALALFRYRVWTAPVAMLAAAGSAVGEWLHDMYFYYPEAGLMAWLAFLLFMAVSAVAIAGVGSWLLVRSLARAGALVAFPSGDAHRA